MRSSSDPMPVKCMRKTVEEQTSRLYASLRIIDEEFSESSAGKCVAGPLSILGPLNWLWPPPSPDICNGSPISSPFCAPSSEAHVPLRILNNCKTRLRGGATSYVQAFGVFLYPGPLLPPPPNLKLKDTSSQLLTNLTVTAAAATTTTTTTTTYVRGLSIELIALKRALQ
jgi:hypothetical protein